MFKKFMFPRHFTESVRRTNMVLIAIIVIITAGYIVHLNYGGISPYMNYALVAGVFLLFPVFRLSKAYLRYSTTRIILDEESISKYVPGKGKVRIRYSRVREMDKDEKGLYIDGDKRYIFIDSRIEKFEELCDDIAGEVEKNKSEGET